MEKENNNSMDSSEDSKPEEIPTEGTIMGVPYKISTNKPPRTQRYYEVLDFIKKNDIKAIPFDKAIEHILTVKYLPKYSREGIKEIEVFEDAKILSLHCKETEIIFKKRFKIARLTGWYVNVTGVRLGYSEICDYIDSQLVPDVINRIKGRILYKAPITLTPIAIKPNENAYVLSIGDFNILLDAAISSKRSLISVLSGIKIDVIVLTHAHYDHMSSIFDLYEHRTHDLELRLGDLKGAKLLGMEDSEWADYPVLLTTSTVLSYLVFKKRRDKRAQKALTRLLKHAHPVKFNEPIELDEGVSIEFYNAGHIPGSAMALIKVDNFSFLYTGDFFLRKRLPCGSAKPSIDAIPGPLDVLMIDCSFINKVFPPENELFDSLMVEISKVLFQNGGNVLIAADLGSVDIMLYLKIFRFFSKMGVKPPVFMDKKSVEYMKILKTRLSDQVGIMEDFDVDVFDPFSSVMRKELRSDINLVEAVAKPSIIITHPSNLNHPPITNYLRFLASNSKNMIVITGAQRKGNAREVLDGSNVIRIKYREVGKHKYSEENLKINMEIFNHKFPDKIIASHADREQIQYTIDKLMPKIIIPFHASISTIKENLPELNIGNARVYLLESSHKKFILKEN